jgi:hypothetical protein
MFFLYEQLIQLQKGCNLNNNKTVERDRPTTFTQHNIHKHLRAEQRNPTLNCLLLQLYISVRSCVLLSFVLLMNSSFDFDFSVYVISAKCNLKVSCLYYASIYLKKTFQIQRLDILIIYLPNYKGHLNL